MSSFKTKVLSVLGSRLMAQAKVEEVEAMSDRFRLITLSSEKFSETAMQPATKIRLNAGNWEMRAYTPLSIDATTRRIQILAYLHGESPGSSWARSAVPGDLTHILGPQVSLDLAGLSRPAVFFGDETSFAAAKTLQSHLAPGHAMLVFEISSTAEAQAIAARLDLRDIQFYERQPDGAHIPLVTEAIRHTLGAMATPHLVLTGNGRSIQAIRTRLRSTGSGVIDYLVKAYWSPGKTGLE